MEALQDVYMLRLKMQCLRYKTMVNIEALMKDRRAELHLLLRRYSPRSRLGRFKSRYNDTYNVLVICPPNKENNWLSFDIIEPLQMFCHMFSLLWHIEVDEETRMLKVVIQYMNCPKSN